MRRFLTIALSSLLVLACSTVTGPPGAPPPGSIQPSAPVAVAGGAPTVTVDPLPATPIVIGQPLTIVAHASDPLGVSRVELRASDAIVQTVTAPTATGVPLLDATLTWTPTVTGPTALVVIAYRADGTASSPTTLAVSITDGSTAGTVSFPPTGSPEPGASPTATPVAPGATATPEPNRTPRPRRSHRPRPTGTPTETAPTTQLPDLLIAAMDVPATLTEGETATAQILVENSSAVAAEAFRVSVRDVGPDGVETGLEGYFFENGIGAGESVLVDTTIQLAGPGTHTITAQADRYEYIAEARENNNEMSATIEVEGASGDLFFKNFTVTNPVTPDVEATGAMYIKNAGPGDVGPSYVSIYGGCDNDQDQHESISLAAREVRGLASGEEAFVSFKYTFSITGDCFVGATIDSGDAIDEPDEDNNKVRVAITSQ